MLFRQEMDMRRVCECVCVREKIKNHLSLSVAPPFTYNAWARLRRYGNQQRFVTYLDRVILERHPKPSPDGKGYLFFMTIRDV